jgi:NAD(P)-dependent dehydrogenase (short-subunit alcohol dehydrogenase family)
MLLQTETQVMATFGPVDILVNAAGGNTPQATISESMPFFDLDINAVDQVFRVNFTGTFQCSQIFGRRMAERQQGSIINVASMSAIRPLSRVVAYSSAKAAVVNFTQWLAVYMAQTCSPKIRVNAISPGFFLTEQNRFLLTDAQTGELTPRGASILAHTPMGRFGVANDLLGVLCWLASPASSFVTGIVIPVDGGFSAFSGV